MKRYALIKSLFYRQGKMKEVEGPREMLMLELYMPSP